MAIFSLTISIDAAPGGAARFLVVIGLLLALGVLAVPCVMIGVVGIAQAIVEAL